MIGDCKSNYSSCSNCAITKKIDASHVNIVKKCILHYAHGITILERNLTPEAIKKLSTALRIFNHVAKPPFYFTHLAEIGLQYCHMNKIEIPNNILRKS